jgi:flagellar biosynthesis protein
MNGRPAPNERNLRERAVALQYHESDELPKVIATGAGEIAREIMQIAREHNIPIQEDETLTDLLSQLSVGSPISPESFRIVAELICFLYQTDKDFKVKHPELKGVVPE